VLLPRHVEGSEESAHPHCNGSPDPGGRVRMGDRSRPTVVGQRSVREKEWLETLRIFGIGKEDGKRIINKLGLTLLDEHEKLFDTYCRYTFGPSSSL
jgi:hypothetical protein